MLLLLLEKIVELEKSIRKNATDMGIDSKKINHVDTYDQNFSKELLDNAIIYDTFGGELNIDKQKGLDKFIVKMVSKSMDKNRKIEILNKNINNFIENIKEVNNLY